MRPLPRPSLEFVHPQWSPLVPGRAIAHSRYRSTQPARKLGPIRRNRKNRRCPPDRGRPGMSGEIAAELRSSSDHRPTAHGNGWTRAGDGTGPPRRTDRPGLLPGKRPLTRVYPLITARSSLTLRVPDRGWTCPVRGLSGRCRPRRSDTVRGPPQSPRRPRLGRSRRFPHRRCSPVATLHNLRCRMRSVTTQRRGRLWIWLLVTGLGRRARCPRPAGIAPRSRGDNWPS